MLRVQLLLVPSKTKAWPLTLTLLDKFQPIPTRLRNGKVGLLLDQADTQEVMSALRNSKSKEDISLDAMKGFVTKRQSRRVTPIALTVSCCVGLLAIFAAPQLTHSEPQTIIQKDVAEVVENCAAGPEVQQSIKGKAKLLHSVTIGNEEFKVASVNRLGGLVQLKLKRSCDSKYFRIDAWSISNELKVSKVY